MIFDLLVVIILVGSVLGGLKLSALLKAGLVIFVIILALQFMPSNITAMLVKGSKLYGFVRPLAREVKGKINLPVIKTWFANLRVAP